MSLSPTAAEWAVEYEKHCGEPPTATMIDSFSHTMETATKQGKKHAQQNLPMDNNS